jgi:hypothetical protein
MQLTWPWSFRSYSSRQGGKFRSRRKRSWAWKRSNKVWLNWSLLLLRLRTLLSWESHLKRTISFKLSILSCMQKFSRLLGRQVLHIIWVLRNWRNVQRQWKNRSCDKLASKMSYSEAFSRAEWWGQILLLWGRIWYCEEAWKTIFNIWFCKIL